MSSSSDSEEPISKKRRVFDVSTKLRAIAEAEKTMNKRGTAKKYGVKQSVIQKWCNHKEQLEKQQKENGKTMKRIQGGGRKLKDADFDRDLVAWFREKREQKLRVTRQMLQRQALLIWTDDGDFKASNGWLQKFLERHGLSTRRPTTICQKVPKEYIPRIVDYILYLEKLRKENNYISIFACDETGIWLDQLNSLTIADRGSKDVAVLSTGHDKMRISVMLTARDDGVKCKPFVLLNRVRPDLKIVSKFSGKLQLHWGGTTWMNDESIAIYLQKTLGSLSFGKRLIVWDSFSAHKSAATNEKLRELKVDSILVAGRCTKYIQAPDVVWNAPFKARIRSLYEDWMVFGQRPLNKNGNPAPPPMETYLEWVWIAWNERPKNLIIHSFKTCAITTSTDGSEDGLIHCFKKDGPIPEGAKQLADARIERAISGINNHLSSIELKEDVGNESDTSIVDLLD